MHLVVVVVVVAAVVVIIQFSSFIRVLPTANGL
jgi:hypothetical protein